MERQELKAVLENIFLISDQPVTVDRLWETFQNEVEKTDLREAIAELREDYRNRNLQIVEVAEGHQLCTRGEFGEWIKRYLKLDKSARLSQPALDTLSIIAYKQPLTRAEVEDIRGVDSGGVVKTLLEKGVICPAGKKKVPGRPVMYRTTRKFLEYFGLKDLSDMPTLEDFKEGELAGAQEIVPVQTNLDFQDPDDAPSPSGEAAVRAGENLPDEEGTLPPGPPEPDSGL
ncbi:MAG: SMC-Scp complex subunit ScpB [Nitrospinae bacterium]|nr:SMC-Scp complex subunit ScpB [Nitrospinota bacterium]